MNSARKIMMKMLNNKKGVELTNIMIGVILVGMITLGGVSFIVEQSINHNVTGVDMGFNSTFDHLEEISTTTEDVRTNIQGAELISVEGFAGLFTGAFSILRIVLNIIFLPITILTDLGTILGLPYWFSMGISSILILIVAFAIANIVFGRGRA